jgi:hypothetical protein
VFRRGQFGLIAAGPGAGKSAFTLAYTLKSRVPALYLSADSDAFEQLKRAICIATGVNQDKAARMILDNDLDSVKEALAGLPVRLNYQASPTLDDVETSIAAYEEVYGEYPSLIVIDNVTNLRGMSESGDPFEGLEGLMDYLSTMARETQACVLGLHHVVGEFNNSDRPIPLSGVKGQISRVPVFILSLFRPGPDLLGVSAVKYRGGQADMSGKSYAELEFRGDSMTIQDPSYPMSAAPATEPAPVQTETEQPF